MTVNAITTPAIPKKSTYRTLCPVTPCRSGMLATTAGGWSGFVSRWSPDFESSNCIHPFPSTICPMTTNQYCSQMVPPPQRQWGEAADARRGGNGNRRRPPQPSIPRRRPAGRLFSLSPLAGEAEVIGARFSDVRAACDSLPPCGGGLGWGVVPWGTILLHSLTPTPDPSPQGGGEAFAAPLRLNLTPAYAGRPYWGRQGAQGG